MKGENDMITITVDGEQFNPDKENFDYTAASIDAWYDRHTRDWVIQVLNKDGYDVRDCIRAGDKKAKDAIVRDLKEEYGL